MTGDRNGGVGPANADGVLRFDSEAVCLALFQAGHMAMAVADRLEGHPICLAIFLVLNNEACDFTSSVAFRPLPGQPHLGLLYIGVVNVLRWTRRICYRKAQN